MILRLTYEDPSPPKRRHTALLTRSPPFDVLEEKAAEPWNTSIEVHASPGHEVVVTATVGLAKETRFQPGIPGYRDFRNFVQARAVGRHPTPLSLTYRVKPFRSERALVVVSYVTLLALPLLFLLAAIVPPFALPIGDDITINYPPPAKYAQAVGAVGVPAIVAVMALSQATSINRLWYFLPLGLYVVLLFWTGP